MVTTNGGPLRAPDTSVVFSPNTATVTVGETITIDYSSGSATPSSSVLNTLFGGIATSEVAGGIVGTISISGVSAGSVTIAPRTSLGNSATMGAGGFTLTVTAPADDQNFLNERGLAHFWGNIDSAKQNKLTAGSNITINNDTISATQPTVNNATLTIKQNSTTLGTFTANASTGTTVTISTPTRTTIYNNGAGTNANFSTTSAMSNFDIVEISYRDGNQNYAFKYIPGPAGSFVLDVVHPGANSTAYWYMSRYLVSGTNITVGANNMRKAIGASSITTTAAQDIYITRIVGIKL